MALPNFCVSMWLPNGAQLIENDYSDAMAAQVRWRGKSTVAVHQRQMPFQHPPCSWWRINNNINQKFGRMKRIARCWRCDNSTRQRQSCIISNRPPPCSISLDSPFLKWATDIVNSCHGYIVRTTIHDPDVNICARTMRITEAAKTRPLHGNMLNCYL